MSRAAENTAQAEVALAREVGPPDRSWEVGYMLREGDRSDMVMFQIAFELPFWKASRQDRVVESKLRLQERAREQSQDHLRMLRADLQAAYSEWQRNGERLANFDARILPDAQARIDALSAAYRAGRAELGAVLEARRTLTDSRIQRFAVEVAQAKARAKHRVLLRASGVKKTLALVILAAAVFAGLGYWLGTRREHAPVQKPVAAATDARKPLYWYDPMYPQHKFDKPGKSPFMDMQLVPKYADEGGADSRDRLDQRAHGAEPRRAHRRGAQRLDRAALRDHRLGGLQRACRRAAAGARRRLRREAACARAARPRDARARRWSTSCSPSGPARRKNSCCCGAANRRS